MRRQVFVPALVLVLAGCGHGGGGGPVAPSSGLRQVHDPGHVTYSLRPANCHARPGPTPDPQCTPGAIDPAVTEGTMRDTICKTGYTKSVRPRTSETDPAKRAQYQAYGIAPDTEAELDHLVPLELGGANDIANLWPEVGGIPNPKDHVEGDLKRAVCDGKVRLADAQQAIASDWTTAEQRLSVS